MPDVFQDRKRKLDLLRALRLGKKGTASVSSAEYIKCTDCMAEHTRETLVQSLYLCPRCGCHLRMPVRLRLALVFDGGSFKEKFSSVKQRDPLSFPGYAAKLEAAKAATGLNDACVCAAGLIGGAKAIVAALDAGFVMGSMGIAVGEKITLAAEYARVNRLPLVIFAASGGARMQEGIFSLMQMAKTSAAIARLSESGGLYVACITHPTTGGVTASFASLADITLAEPGALFGFAGPRVIEQTIGESLPVGFQLSEFQLAHGFVDAIVTRTELPGVLARLLSLHGR